MQDMQSFCLHFALDINKIGCTRERNVSYLVVFNMSQLSTERVEMSLPADSSVICERFSKVKT